MGKASNSEQTQHKQNNANRWRLPIKSLVHKTNVWFVGLAQLSSQFLYTTHTPQATSSVLADTALKQLLLLPSLLPQNIIVGFCSKMLKLSQRLIKLFFRNIHTNSEWECPVDSASALSAAAYQLPLWPSCFRGRALELSLVSTSF